MMETVLLPLAGGALIGLASALLLVLSGRVAGVSGIAEGLFIGPAEDRPWRAAFVVGLVIGGGFMAGLYPAGFAAEGLGPIALMAVSGLLVGFGSRLGGGCTSGHGVCGLGRLSPRSTVATLTFMATGALTVFVAEHVL